MPLYEYQCSVCGTSKDIRHGFDETTSDVCSNCGGALQRTFNAAGIVFKGSGFYVTDSRKGSGDGASKSGSAAASTPAKTESSDAPKADAPAAKAETKSETATKSDGGGKSEAAA